MSLNIDINRMLPVKISGGSPNLLSKLLTLFFEHLPKTQHRIRKDVDLRALKIDDSFVTNQWQRFPWMILPTNCFQSWDLILFRHQSRRYVEHFSCEYCWFHCYSHKHSPNHRMFFFIWKSFLSFSHLVIHPIHEWSWFYWQFQFCFIVSNDEILRSCHFLSIDIIRSPRSVTRCFLVPNGLRGSVVKSFLVRETRSNFSCRSPRSFIRSGPIARVSQYQFSTLEKTKHGRHPTLSSLLKRKASW